MEQYLAQDGFAFTFDITQGYHHVDVHPDFYEYLGFHWHFEGEVRYFVFVVLPFGLTSAPFVFTKIVRCLVKFWRGQGIKICVYLDDGLGVENSSVLARKHSKIVERSLLNSGFLANKTKIIWEPTQTISWLGISTDLHQGLMYITEKRVKTLFETLDSIIELTGFNFEVDKNLSQMVLPEKNRIEILRKCIAPMVSEFYPEFAKRIWGV